MGACQFFNNRRFGSTYKTPKSFVFSEAKGAGSCFESPTPFKKLFFNQMKHPNLTSLGKFYGILEPLFGIVCAKGFFTFFIEF